MKHKKHQPQKHFGRIQKNRNGFAFILAENPTLPDVYVSARDAAGLLNYDEVEYVVHRQGRSVSAKIIRIVERGKKSVLGIVRFFRKTHCIETNDGEVFLLDKKAPVGEWVVADIKNYPNERSPGSASIRETIGKKLLPMHDNLVSIDRFALPSQFSHSVHEQSKFLQERFLKEKESPRAGRQDLRALPFVTIDGEDAKDFDDAILVKETGDGFTLWVAIADVSFFVTEGTALDREAKNRGTSVYLPGTCIPMLPEILSNDLCSLRPNTDRLALIAEIRMNKKGAVTGTQFFEAIINTKARLTYTQVHEWMTKGSETTINPQVIGSLRSAVVLYRVLRELRERRGVLDFDLPEARVILNKAQEPIELGYSKQYESNRLIEEFMIAANREVAKRTREMSQPSIYRVHAPPDAEAMDEIKQLIKTHGLSLSLKESDPLFFSKFLEATRKLKAGPTIHQKVLRMQSRALYTPSPDGHYGLALKDYTHFTSPIRRYPDLVVHRALKKVILKKHSSEKEDEGLSNLHVVGSSCSWLERRAAEAERFTVKRKQCWFLLNHLGEAFSGVISGITENGLFLEWREYAVDGFLPLGSLKGFYQYDERRHCLVRRPGHQTLTIGDSLDVVLSRVSVEDNQIELVLTK